MSCCIKPLAAFSDFNAVKRFLRPSDGQESEVGWDDVSWKWDESDADVVAFEKRTEESWLQDCFISYSPAGDCLVLATTERLVCMTLKWDMHEPGDIKAKFVIQFESNLVEDIKDEISSVLCLPLASQKRTSHGSPDWTCVIVGFSSGHVRMYTETGVQLFSQLFHEGTVTKIKCQTYEPPRHTKDPEHSEELFIIYPRAIVTIDGFSLIQTLRACRNQVARATAIGVDMNAPPPLAYKKWGFHDQEKVVDCENVGLIPPNTFDHLQTASLLGGFTSKPRNAIPVATLFLGSGQFPYLAFYYAIEGSAQPFMSEVVTAVASKLKSVLFSAASGFFGNFSKSSSEERIIKPKIEPATPLACRFGLPDARRLGDSIIVSPNKRVAVVTDTFGRIVLVDTHQGIIVRMWKGYRDAQCGWMEVTEDTHQMDKEKVTSIPRIALFLVIYAPRRGLLEIWTAQQGPRIAAFNVSKTARLLCPAYSMMGINAVVASNHGHKLAQCFLLDVDGSLKTICTPFHYALSDKNSKCAQSLHLLKKLKITLKETEVRHDSEKNEIVKILLTIKTPNIRKQALETVVKSDKIQADFLTNVMNILLEQLESQGMDSLDFESKLVLESCHRLKTLLKFYCGTREIELNSCEETVEPTPDNTSLQILLAAVLHQSEAELEHLISILKRHTHDKKTKTVYFADNKVLTVAKFLSYFSVFVSCLEKGVSINAIELVDGLEPDALAILGRFLFHQSLTNSSCLEKLKPVIVECSLSPERLMTVLMHFWLNESSTLISTHCLINLSTLVKFISSLSDLQFLAVTSNETSSWWQTVRSILCQTTNVPMAFAAALVCRGVSVMFAPTLESESKASGDTGEKTEATTSKDDTEWESISIDALQWNVLVKQLEDLTVLHALFGFKLENTEECLQIEVSCNSLLDKGRGIVSELIAKWLIYANLDTKLLKIDGEETNTPEIAKEATRVVNRDECLGEIIGLACLIWHMNLSKMFTATALLMEKVAKVPKERLCRRDIGISDTILIKFVGCCTDILDILMDANVIAESESAPVFDYEDLWQSTQGPNPLVELAINQKAANYSLLCHHYQLALSMQMMVTFGIKSVRLISLYDTKGKSAFFRELDTYPQISSGRGLDDTIINSRRQFLCKVISAAVQSIPEPIPDPHQSENSSIPAITVDHSGMSFWVGRVIELAKMWEMDLDFLRRHHVCELYNSGLDSLAEEMLPSVSDRIVLGSQLILLAGQRLGCALKEKYTTVEVLARLSPNLTSWIKSLDQSTLRCLNPPLTMTAALIGNIINHLPDGDSQYQMAFALIDAVNALLEFSDEIALRNKN
uniref:Rab3-GAP regulatory subunit N-terminal domain-containing protein n=1 Tax=Strigamia maritima TaxID=126957 RepID=T1IPV9_STRMM